MEKTMGDVLEQTGSAVSSAWGTFTSLTLADLIGLAVIVVLAIVFNNVVYRGSR
jgi:hypothetical protein